MGAAIAVAEASALSGSGLIVTGSVLSIFSLESLFPSDTEEHSFLASSMDFITGELSSLASLEDFCGGSGGVGGVWLLIKSILHLFALLINWRLKLSRTGFSIEFRILKYSANPETVSWYSLQWLHPDLQVLSSLSPCLNTGFLRPLVMKIPWYIKNKDSQTQQFKLDNKLIGDRAKLALDWIT